MIRQRDEVKAHTEAKKARIAEMREKIKRLQKMLVTTTNVDAHTPLGRRIFDVRQNHFKNHFEKLKY